MRHILQDGQFYYSYVVILVTAFCGFKGNVSSITIFFTLLAAVTVVSPVGPIYQVAFMVPAFAMELIMTCKVFRATILRSLDRAQSIDIDLSAARMEAHTTAMSIFELDTVLEHRLRMNIECEY